MPGIADGGVLVLVTGQLLVRLRGESRQPFPLVVLERARSLLLLTYHALGTSQQDNG